MSAVAVTVFAVLALIGTPLAFAIGLGALVALHLEGFSLIVLTQRMMFAVNSFPLMAIPLFMLAGELMVKAGIVERLIGFANAVVGRVQGGVAHVTILAGLVFASVSGAAVASASALGTTLVPALRKNYPVGYSSAVVASAANLGPVIPPSNAMIVYALMAGSSVSVGGMFMAGIVPGLILTAGFMALASFIAKRRGYELSGTPFRFRNVLVETRRAALILLMPVLVVGGIVGGVFTATEGAAVSVIYALFVGLFVTKELALADLPGCLFRAAVTAAMVGALIAFAAVLTYVFTLDLVPIRLSAFIKDLTSDPLVFIALTMVMLLVVGMLIESNAAYIMLVPLFAPLAIAYGIDPLFFGFLFMYNLVIGMMTPPVGVLLFVMSGITRVPMSTLTREVMPFVALQFGVLALCIAFPSLVLWLPRQLGF